MAIRDSTLGQVVGTHFDGHPITWKDSDEELSHLPADVCEKLLAVFETHLEAGVGECLHDFRVECDFVLFGHME